MLRLSGWTIGYVVTNQIALLFVLVLAKSGTTGDVSAYLYGTRSTKCRTDSSRFRS